MKYMNTLFLIIFSFNAASAHDCEKLNIPSSFGELLPYCCKNEPKKTELYCPVATSVACNLKDESRGTTLYCSPSPIKSVLSTIPESLKDLGLAIYSPNKRVTIYAKSETKQPYLVAKKLPLGAMQRSAAVGEIAEVTGFGDIVPRSFIDSNQLYENFIPFINRIPEGKSIIDDCLDEISGDPSIRSKDPGHFSISAEGGTEGSSELQCKKLFPLIKKLDIQKIFLFAYVAMHLDLHRENIMLHFDGTNIRAKMMDFESSMTEQITPFPTYFNGYTTQYANNEYVKGGINRREPAGIIPPFHGSFEIIPYKADSIDPSIVKLLKNIAETTSLEEIFEKYEIDKKDREAFRKRLLTVNTLLKTHPDMGLGEILLRLYTSLSSPLFDSYKEDWNLELTKVSKEI